MTRPPIAAGPGERELVEATPRKAMTPTRRARILTKSNGHCAYPCCEIDTGLEIDHVICLELGGKDEDSNLEALCAVHHKRKTSLDRKLIAKARRRRLKDRGEFPESKSRIRSRGFAKGRNRAFEEAGR